MTTPSDITMPGGLWTCPLHPAVRETAPGVCPHCGAPLVSAGTTPGPTGPAAPGGDAAR